jgi:hypothetical protein
MKSRYPGPSEHGFAIVGLHVCAVGQPSCPDKAVLLRGLQTRAQKQRLLSSAQWSGEACKPLFHANQGHANRPRTWPRSKFRTRSCVRCTKMSAPGLGPALGKGAGAWPGRRGPGWPGWHCRCQRLTKYIADPWATASMGRIHARDGQPAVYVQRTWRRGAHPFSSSFHERR